MNQEIINFVVTDYFVDDLQGVYSMTAACKSKGFRHSWPF